MFKRKLADQVFGSVNSNYYQIIVVYLLSILIYPCLNQQLTWLFFILSFHFAVYYSLYGTGIVVEVFYENKQLYKAVVSFMCNRRHN